MPVYQRRAQVVDNVKWPNIHVDGTVPVKTVWHFGVSRAQRPRTQNTR
jgi:hypothetical protein